MTLGTTNLIAGHCRSARGRLLYEERGSVSMVHAVSVAFFTMLIVMLGNVGHIAHQKVEMQNAADSAAITTATWQARGMNAITSTNHVMGEMLAFVALHEAIGGQRLDDSGMGPSPETKDVDEELDRAQAAAEAMGASTPAYETVRQKEGVHADRTLLDSKIRLKKWLTWIYYMKAAAKAMQESSIPPVVAAGIALEKLMDAFEKVIEAEYKILKALHKVAEGLTGLKELLRDDMLPEAKRYTELVVERTPRIAARAARQIAKENNTLGTVFPKIPELPVQIDPFARATRPCISDDQRVPAGRGAGSCPSKPAWDLQRQVNKTSQLCRATWPWVHYHRKPILDFLSMLPWSNARKHYFDETAGATIYLCRELQLDSEHDLGLYVLKGYPAPDKGYALWTKDAKKADNLFSTVGLVYREKPIVFGEPMVFHQAHPDGRVAMAQAMLYNANQQRRAPHYINLECARIVPYQQADVGWDTLNWEEGSCPSELLGIEDASIPPVFPRIKVNWQAKLVPLTTTQLKKVYSSSEIPEPFAALTRRLLPEVPRSLRTH